MAWTEPPFNLESYQCEQEDGDIMRTTVSRHVEDIKIMGWLRCTKLYYKVTI